MSSFIRFRRIKEAVVDAEATTKVENLDFVWLRSPGALRTLPEIGWSSEAGANESTAGPTRPMPYDISTYGTTVYVICSGAFVGMTLLDVNTNAYFIGDTAMDRVFSKLFAMGFIFHDHVGVAATIKAIRAFVKNVSAKDRDDLSIEINHLTHTDSAAAQNSYMDLLTFAGDFGVGTVGCSAETLGTFEYVYMDRAKAEARAKGKPYANAVNQIALLFSEVDETMSDKLLKDAAETHALQVAQGFRVTTWDTGLHSVSKHGAIRLLDVKEMVWYSSNPAAGMQYFKKRATAFVGTFPVLAAGLHGLNNPTSLMRTITDFAEAFEIDTPVPHVMAERIATEVTRLAVSVTRRQDDEHAEEWARRICLHKSELRSSGKSLELRRFDGDSSSSSKGATGARAKEYATVWASEEFERTSALLVKLRSENATLEQLAEVALTCRTPPELHPTAGARLDALLDEERDAKPITLLLQVMLNSTIDPRTATPTIPFLAELRDKDTLGRVMAKRAIRSVMQIGPAGNIPAALRTLCLRDLVDQILDFEGKIDWIQCMLSPILAAFNAAKIARKHVNDGGHDRTTSDNFQLQLVSPAAESCMALLGYQEFTPYSIRAAYSVPMLNLQLFYGTNQQTTIVTRSHEFIRATNAEALAPLKRLLASPSPLDPVPTRWIVHASHASSSLLAFAAELHSEASRRRGRQTAGGSVDESGVMPHLSLSSSLGSGSVVQDAQSLATNGSKSKGTSAEVMLSLLNNDSLVVICMHVTEGGSPKTRAVEMYPSVIDAACRKSFGTSAASECWWHACNAKCPFEGYAGHALTHNKKVLEFDTAKWAASTSKSIVGKPVASMLAGASGFAK